MIELLGSGVLGSLFGGIFRLLPEVLKWLDRKDERKHELDMFKLQTDLEKQRGQLRIEERYVDHSVAQLNAIQEAFKEQSAAAAASYPWVAAASALVRPSITYVLFALYIVVKITVLVYAFMSGATWLEVVQKHYDAEDFAMLNLIITFWFVGRAIERYPSDR